jgi:hypothetical protein
MGQLLCRGEFVNVEMRRHALTAIERGKMPLFRHDGFDPNQPVRHNTAVAFKFCLRNIT